MSSSFNLKLSQRLGLIHSAYVEAELGRQPSQATFYIDTGAPASILSPELCERMQIPVNKLDFIDEIGIGGAIVKVALMDPVKLTFSNSETGEYSAVEMPIYVSKYTSSNPEDVVDNILGMTFFANTPASLYIENESKQERQLKATLEIKD